MTFNQVWEFIKNTKKYSLTKDTNEIFNNRCAPKNNHLFYNPKRGILSSLIKQKVKVEYSDIYILEMYKYIAKFGNNVGLKLDRPELSSKSREKYYSGGLKDEPLQEWTKRLYLQANNEDAIEDYLKSKPERSIWLKGEWLFNVPKTKYFAHRGAKLITKNKAILILLEAGLSPREVDFFIKGKRNDRKKNNQRTEK